MKKSVLKFTVKGKHLRIKGKKFERRFRISAHDPFRALFEDLTEKCIQKYRLHSTKVEVERGYKGGYCRRCDRLVEIKEASWNFTPHGLKGLHCISRNDFPVFQRSLPRIGKCPSCNDELVCFDLKFRDKIKVLPPPLPEEVILHYPELRESKPWVFILYPGYTFQKGSKHYFDKKYVGEIIFPYLYDLESEKESLRKFIRETIGKSYKAAFSYSIKGSLLSNKEVIWTYYPDLAERVIEECARNYYARKIPVQLKPEPQATVPTPLVEEKAPPTPKMPPFTGIVRREYKPLKMEKPKERSEFEKRVAKTLLEKAFALAKEEEKEGLEVLYQRFVKGEIETLTAYHLELQEHVSGLKYVEPSIKTLRMSTMT